MRPGTFEVGHKKRGGREKGTKNHVNQIRREAMEEGFARLGVPVENLTMITPLQTMLAAMQLAWEDGDVAAALHAASLAAPFCHARLSTVDMRLKNDLSEKTSAELEAEAQELAVKLGITLH